MNENRSDRIHQAIDLIYETAIEPGKWPELLHALAGFAETRLERDPGEVVLLEQALLNDSVSGGTERPQRISLHSALEHIGQPVDSSDERLDAPQPAQNDVNRILLGHFKRAIQIAKRLVDLEEQHEVLVSLLDHLPIALFVVDQHAAILEANNQASQMLSEKVTLRAIEGKLVAPLRFNTKKLHEAIHDVVGKGSTGTVPAMNRGLALTLDCSETDQETRDDDFEEDLMLFITPIAHSSPTEKPRVAVFVSSRKFQPVIVPEQTAHFYGLTAKEMAITTALVQGHSIKKITSDSSVSEHTVRSQVKSILQKTGTGRQSDLVRLMLTGPGAMMPVRVQDTGIETSKTSQNESQLIFKGLPLPDTPRFLFLRDGRRMAYREYGDPLGEPLFYCHSLLGSRLELAFEGSRAAKERGIRLIIPDRPGIGCSDSRPDIGFLEWVEDLKALADYLKINRFCMAGYAMGGQYALATAFAMPNRVKRLSLVSVGLRPESVADFKDMQTFYRFNLKLLLHARPVYRLFSALMRKGFFSNPDNFFQQFGAKMGAGDLTTFKDKRFRKMLISNMTEGWRQGALIPCQEIENWMADSWDFNVKSIKIPIDFWHGEQDHHVPCVLGKALTKCLPKAKIFIEPEQGHLLFFSHWAKMLDALLDL